MSLASVHPLYSDFKPRWELMRDSYDGERKIKERGFLYLPPTRGMRLDGVENTQQPGFQAYDAYRQRAVYHDFIEAAVRKALGKLHRKPSVIELPTALEPLRERATVNGDSLDLLHMKINEEQLITGRIGLLLDLPSTPGAADIPYVATYTAERVRNWDDGRREDPVLQTLNLVILDESEFERGPLQGSVGEFEWEHETKYRVLVLGDVEANEGAAAGSVYSQALFTGEDTTFDPSQLITPQIRGRTLDKIPFVFINPMDTLVTPDKPPLESLARLTLTIYRGEADYRQSLFMQGQDTLVLIGVADEGEGATRVGANAEIRIPSTEGDAKYIGVESSGLPEQRAAIENDMEKAESMSGSMIQKARSIESGDALRRRMTASSISLTDIATAGAAGLERILKIAAEWVGANPDQVIVTPNLDFEDDELMAGDVTQWIAASNMGAPLSRKSIWENLKEGELTRFETFEEEMEQIEAEGVFRDDVDMPGGGGVDDDDDDGDGGSSDDDDDDGDGGDDE